MAKIVKLLALFGFTAVIAACGQQQQQEEFIVVEPEPITEEPTETGKYK